MASLVIFSIRSLGQNACRAVSRTLYDGKFTKNKKGGGGNRYTMGGFIAIVLSWPFRFDHNTQQLIASAKSLRPLKKWSRGRSYSPRRFLGFLSSAAARNDVCAAAQH